MAEHLDDVDLKVLRGAMLQLAKDIFVKTGGDASTAAVMAEVKKASLEVLNQNADLLVNELMKIKSANTEHLSQLKVALAFGQVDPKKMISQLPSLNKGFGVPISGDPDVLQPGWQKDYEEQREEQEQIQMNAQDPNYKKRTGPNRLESVKRARMATQKEVNTYWEKRCKAQKLLQDVYEKAAVKAVEMQQLQPMTD